MRRNVSFLLKTLLSIAAFVVVAWFGVATYYSMRRAKMHSQVSVLSVDIAQHLAKGSVDVSVDDYLREYDEGSLVDRDDEGRLIDAWGSPLVVEVADAGAVYEVAVTSIGRDRVAGTADDFTRGFQPPNRAFKENEPNTQQDKPR